MLEPADASGAVDNERGAGTMLQDEVGHLASLFRGDRLRVVLPCRRVASERACVLEYEAEHILELRRQLCLRFRLSPNRDRDFVCARPIARGLGGAQDQHSETAIFLLTSRASGTAVTGAETVLGKHGDDMTW
jgi:hypothetical protein